MGVLGVKNISDLILPKSLDEFININSGRYFKSTRQKQFFLRLFGLYAFSPLTALQGYKMFMDVCDNFFFQMIEEM